MPTQEKYLDLQHLISCKQIPLLLRLGAVAEGAEGLFGDGEDAEDVKF